MCDKMTSFGPSGCSRYLLKALQPQTRRLEDFGNVRYHSILLLLTRNHVTLCLKLQCMRF